MHGLPDKAVLFEMSDAPTGSRILGGQAGSAL
jgi:hypothetical protein